MTKEEILSVKTISENGKTFRDMIMVGVENFKIKSMVSGETETIYRAEFSKDEKYGKYLNWSISRYENKFNCIVSFI